jgi:hypothetical protein
VYGGGTRTPPLGRNISRDDYNRATNGGRDRFDANRLGWGNRNWNDGDWRGNNWGNRWNGGWNNNWANGGYWGDRSWSYGWYNWSPNTWGWWGGNAAGWGLAGLSTSAVITDLVDQAGDQQSSVIQVPDSNYQLNYGTVDAVGNSGANFAGGGHAGPVVDRMAGRQLCGHELPSRVPCSATSRGGLGRAAL